MKITSLNIEGFGKFKNKSIDFTDGLNVVYGDNEAGKSTTHSFIKSMLFGMKKRKSKLKTDLYTKYYPWGTDGIYAGTLNFTHNNKNYQIHRVFHEANPVFEIIDLDLKGKKLKNPELFLNRVMCNLNVDSFDNTISIGQLKSAQDSSLIDDLHKYIANLNTSGDMSIDTVAAINYLKQKKNELQMSLKSDASIIYNKQLGNIRNLEKELNNKNYENKLPEVLKRKASESRKIEMNNEEIDSLKQDIVEKNMALDNFGFASVDDIDSLRVEANKMFLEYGPIMDRRKQKIKTFFNVLTIILGIAMIIFSLLLLVVTYPDIASTLNIYNVNYALSDLLNLILILPFHPIVLIGVLLCVGIILILGNILLLVSNYQNINKSDEIKEMISDILNQQINDDEVTTENIKLFKKHISNMKKLAKSVEENEARVIVLTKENNALLEKQTEYDDIIKSQQRIQYDVEQKYNELYSLKLENEKVKQDLNSNDTLNKDIESIDLAIDTLNSLSSEIKVMFGTHINKSASKYIEALTNGKYNSLNVDNGLNITINYEDRVIPLNKISTGTIDQVYLATRLAITDIVRGNKEALPLIFDDCFAMYDNERLNGALKFLYKNVDSQIIIFTCHTREESALKSNKAKFNYIKIDEN